MFFLMIFFVFMLAGSFLVMCNYYFPMMGIPLIPIVGLGLQTTVVICVWVGSILYIMRSEMSGGGKFVPLADPKRSICIHVGKSNARFLSAKKEEPNRLRAKGIGRSSYMNIKDVGEPLNISGHDVVITTQDDGHNIPLWLCDLIDKYKKRYGVRNHEELMKLYNEIKKINSYKDLEDIPFLHNVLQNDNTRRKVFDLSLDELRNMAERLYDARTVNIKAYLDWNEGATPYDNETIIDGTVSHRRAQDMSYRMGATGDWLKYIIPIGILFILGAFAYQIFGT